jgi:hypothetical protein
MVLSPVIDLLALVVLLSSVALVLALESSTPHRATAALTGSLSLFALVFRKADP